MVEQSYGRHAVIVSCCFHCMLFIGAGWLGGGIIFSQAAQPETIEMELISSAALPEQAAPVPITMPQAAASSAIQPGTADSARSITAISNPAASAATGDVVAERFSPAAAATATNGGSSSAEAAVPALAAGGSAGMESAPTAAAPAPKKIAAPRILRKVEPDYPEDARQEGFTGTVGVRVEVMENGRPGEVLLARSSGRRSLDEAALQAVRQWRFVPAQEVGSGAIVRCYTTFSVVFELN